jgi:hypothetical protein
LSSIFLFLFEVIFPFFESWMVKMRFGTDELGTGKIGTDGLVNLRLVKPICASLEVSPKRVLHTKNQLPKLSGSVGWWVE